MMGKPIALIVAAGHVLRTLRLALHDFEIVEAGSADAADRLVGRRPSLAVVACDATRPMDGLDAVRRIRASDSRLPIVLVTESSSEDLAIGAIKAGVTAISKFPSTARRLRRRRVISSRRRRARRSLPR